MRLGRNLALYGIFLSSNCNSRNHFFCKHIEWSTKHSPMLERECVLVSLFLYNRP